MPEGIGYGKNALAGRRKRGGFKRRATASSDMSVLKDTGANPSAGEDREMAKKIRRRRGPRKIAGVFWGGGMKEA